MRVLGIDPGLKATGYGLLEIKQEQIVLLEAGTIEPQTKELIHQRIYNIYNNLVEIVNEFRPDVLVLEKLYAHSKHPMTSSLLGHVRGIIYLLCAQKEIVLAEHSVKRIRKAIAGNGNATKSQVRRLVAHQFDLDEALLKFDASDALALALGHIQMKHSQAGCDY